MCEQPALKILGQEISYPKTTQGAVAVSIVSIAFCISLSIIYIWAEEGSYKHVENLFASVQTVYNADGTIASQDCDRRQVQFWTPSYRTYEDVKLTDISPNHSWHKLDPNKKKIELFEKWLKKYGKGWRRMEIYGSGPTGNKNGLWWFVTTRENFEMQEFISGYSQFWGNGSTVYLEEPILKPDFRNGKAIK